jgi:hypothetical protein
VESRATTLNAIERHAVLFLVALLPITAIGIGPVSVGAMAAVLLIGPALIGSARHFRPGRVLRVAIAAVALSPLVAWIALRDPSRSFTSDLAFRSVATFGVAGLTLLVLLWSRRKVGVRATLIAYAAGTAAQAVSVPESWADQPWKYAFAWPVSVLVLGWMYRSSRSVQVCALLGLATYSVVADFRSFAGLCVLAALLIVHQPKAEMPDRRTSIRTGATLAVVGIMLLQAGTWLAMNGHLGQSIQHRTISQTGNGDHSVLVGARPELGATLALMERSPIGMGLGVTPSTVDRASAEVGIQEFGSSGESEYVNEYVLGERVELHSITADLWLVLGPLGLLLALVVAANVIAGLGRLLYSRALHGALALVGVLALWDLLFSPLSNLPHVVVALAMLLPSTVREARPQAVATARLGKAHLRSGASS